MVLSGDHIPKTQQKIENINGNPWQLKYTTHAKHLNTRQTATQYIEQKATTKFIIGLQPQTTTQRFTSTLGNQRTRVYRQTCLQNHNNSPTGTKYIEQKGSRLMIGTTPTNIRAEI